MQMHHVIWQEGMLLRPQHLQHSDRYFHRQLNRTRLLACDAWGFLSLDLDLQYLNMGKVVVSQASGVLPDGSLFELSGAMEPLVLQVPANADGQAVYLALPLATDHQVEVRKQEQREVLARYVAWETEIGDSNAGVDTRCQIHCARPDLRLTLGEQPSDPFYVKLQVARVLDSSHDGGVRLDPDFVPTFIYLQGSGYVSSCIKEVLSLLATRGDAIAARIQGPTRRPEGCRSASC
jgi:type VI secretion system protein ImpJ